MHKNIKTAKKKQKYMFLNCYKKHKTHFYIYDLM